MRGRRIPSGLLALILVAFFLPLGSAQVASCAAPDEDDTGGDVQTDEGVVPDEINGFNRLDIVAFCFTETAEAVQVVVTVGEDIDSTAVNSYTWTFHFRANNATDGTRSLTHSGGSEEADPAGSATAEGDKIQFTLAKTDFAPGTPLGDFFVDSVGTFVDSNGQVLDGGDRAPDAGVSPFTYTVGKRAPAGTDTDGDGVDDAEEVREGSDPTSADKDNDGLNDQEEKNAGTNPNRADTDVDGLSDQEELDGVTTVGTNAVTFQPTDPTSPDTDGDDLDDGDEVKGTRNSAYPGGAFLSGVPGSTDPNVPDTDNDGLPDGAEVNGRETEGGETITFAPTDPNDPDTDKDSLSDHDEIHGERTTTSGQTIEFSPTDPTLEDTDGDGIDDFREVQTGNDPTDPDDTPASAPVADTVQYLPISAGLLLIVVLVSMGGLVWRWG